MSEVRKMQDEEKTSLKTIYSILLEVGSIMNKPIDQLEYLNEGDTPKEKDERAPVNENATITLEMLMRIGHELSRKASEIAKQTNHLTGQ